MIEKKLLVSMQQPLSISWYKIKNTTYFWDRRYLYFEVI